MTHLFAPLALRDLTLRNRIAIPAMCQYSAENGLAGDWHFVHYGTRAVGGAALIVSEATAIVPEGRISPADLGLWDDGQIEALARVVRFAREQGCPMAAQLAHAGRKAGVRRGWEGQTAIPVNEGGWPVVGPSPIAFSGAHATPAELDAAGIGTIVERFAAAARRARAAGFSAVEIHAAHGYLLHQFLSPLANRRTDGYGGSFANRTRLVIEVVDAVRAAWPDRLPLIVRLSATDWVDGGWTPGETVALCRMLKTHGVDLINVSTGGLVPDAKIPAGPGFQTKFAEHVRREADIPSAAVGLITAPAQADHIIRSGQADVVLLGREILRNPYWPMTAAQELGHAAAWPAQYLRAAPDGSVAR
ncbi:MAG: NADH:flavin oxidoreductase/NADH oxidase [Candidatus Accumulibacter sp.]|jgi:2,4-dienoyl-CoA reductase-like NADH-dependent reductase (Old Yellow Enzyme family)|nr:NADH:flavin oxidoreductase/NADH oxidase [Accumulibacter sp.]